uniref:ditrans,polycis-polyprenyl diphosphate synthase [(2E,6E)-farnesyldiphosphate specific] n=1 Tax=Petromyzon marinus TaxID=7757 RepID=A0AAJ7UDA9_PETMA|nr:dehydrodolichyl diphosphate synthase complex subunit NUS1 isoform X2 [Petromyzon marinus]
MALLYALVLRLLHALLALKAKLQRGLVRWDSLGLAWKRRRPRRAFAGGRGRGKGVGGADGDDVGGDEEEEGRRGLEMARHDGRALRKLPVHVGLVLSEAAGAERGVRDVANAVLWCVALGVSYVSVFDARGMLKETNGRLMEEVLRQQREQLGSDWSKRKVEFVDDQSAEALLQGTPALKGFPDPDLVLRFGRVESTLGYPPWQLHLAEIIPVGPLQGLCYEDLHSAMRGFAECEQRFGK